MSKELEAEIQSIYEEYELKRNRLKADSDELKKLTEEYALNILIKMQKPLRLEAINSIKRIDGNSELLDDLKRNEGLLQEEARLTIIDCLKKYDKNYVGKKKKVDSFYKYVKMSVFRLYKRNAVYQKYKSVSGLSWVYDDRLVTTDIKERVPSDKKRFTTVVREISHLKTKIEKKQKDSQYKLKKDEIVRDLVKVSRGYTEEQIKDLIDIIEIPNPEILSDEVGEMINNSTVYGREEALVCDEETKLLIKRIIMDFISKRDPEEQYILENYADIDGRVSFGNKFSFQYKDFFIQTFEKKPLSIQEMKDELFKEFNETWDDANIKRRYKRLLSELNIKMGRLTD
ncbi:MAG: hypothetical protein K5669_11370 [Lachnospiraceae bacterium]|nr:hypothetical protein [Lachnospiraceae bacterium]